MDQLLEPEDEEPTVCSGAPLDTEAGATASPEPPATGQTSNEPLPKRARFNEDPVADTEMTPVQDTEPVPAEVPAPKRRSARTGPTGTSWYCASDDDVLTYLCHSTVQTRNQPKRSTGK